MLLRRNRYKEEIRYRYWVLFPQKFKQFSAFLLIKNINSSIGTSAGDSENLPEKIGLWISVE